MVRSSMGVSSMGVSSMGAMSVGVSSMAVRSMGVRSVGVSSMGMGSGMAHESWLVLRSLRESMSEERVHGVNVLRW